MGSARRPPAAPFTMTSPAFGLGEPIPARHTCDGENHSPALLWTEPPPGTRALAIAMEDADAPSGDFVHWLGWGLEPHLRELPEGVEPPFEGRNGFGRVGYAGPCPRSGTLLTSTSFASSPSGRLRTSRPGRGWTTCASSSPRS